MTIPKIIHYCWFGESQKPRLVKQCMSSWNRHLSSYKFIEWNEENFDVSLLPYTKSAYANKKYAFVSDVARVQALAEFGGIYLDTDVEVFKSFDPILNHQCVLGFEEHNWIATSFMACEKGHDLFTQFASLYENLQFIYSDGSQDPGTNVTKVTNILKEFGLKRNGLRQTLKNGVTILPQEYFSPYDYSNCVSLRTENSFCEHKFDMSWSGGKLVWRKRIKRWAAKMVGRRAMLYARRIFLGDGDKGVKIN